MTKTNNLANIETRDRVLKLAREKKQSGARVICLFASKVCNLIIFFDRKGNGDFGEL
jgi:hypothetical protein